MAVSRSALNNKQSYCQEYIRIYTLKLTRFSTNVFLFNLQHLLFCEHSFCDLSYGVEFNSIMLFEDVNSRCAKMVRTPAG